MKKIKSPWYGVLWIGIWTAALVWFLASGMFDLRESIGLVIVWLTLVGITVWLIGKELRVQRKARAAARAKPKPKPPALNAACPCGSGKKFKRCCGAEGT